MSNLDTSTFQASDKVRRPIGAKIFGITSILLVLMTAVTYTSTTNLKKVNEQLALLSDFYIPLDQAVSEVRGHHLSQILWFERLMAQKPDKSMAAYAELAKPFAAELQPACDRDTLSAVNRKAREAIPRGTERTAVMYELTRVCGDSAIAGATALVESALALPSVKSNPEQIQRFTKLQAQLDDIPRSRDNLHTAIVRYLDGVQANTPGAAELLLEQLEQNRRTVGRDTGGLARMLHGYTQDAAAEARRLERQAFAFDWIVTLIAAALGLAAAAVLTRNLVKPVRELLTGAKAIEQGDLNIKVSVNSTDELALLAKSFNYMVTGLKEKESIKETFGKYIDPRIVRSLLEERSFTEGGDKRVMTVFFSDIEGFTSISEQLTPDAVVRLLNHYFSTMSEPIRDNGGIIDKYIGDAIMAFWGPPFAADNEHAILACHAALDQFARLEAFRAALPDVLGLRRGLPDFNLRMGISTGNVTVGSIGSETTKSYTVIGDTANLASRLEAVNKQFGTRIVISEDTWKMARAAIEARELDRIRVVGKAEPARVFELLGRKGQVDAERLALRDAFEQGLAAYRARDWATAETRFEHCLTLAPDDGPAKLFLKRLAVFRRNPPDESWDGVWSFLEK